MHLQLCYSPPASQPMLPWQFSLLYKIGTRYRRRELAGVEAEHGSKVSSLLVVVALKLYSLFCCPYVLCCIYSQNLEQHDLLSLYCPCHVKLAVKTMQNNVAYLFYLHIRLFTSPLIR